MKLIPTPNSEATAVIKLSKAEALEVIQELARQLSTEEDIELFVFHDD